MTSLRDFPADANIAELGPALLYVNVQWCGFCKRTKPVMEKVSGILGSVVPVYSIDADERPDVAEAFKVNKYPTILYLDKYGKVYPYNGDRTLDAIVSAVCHYSDSHPFCERYKFK